MENIIVKAKSESDIKFIVSLLKSMDKVASVKLEKKLSKKQRAKKKISVAAISESSLAKEWNSPEDERWNDLLK